MIHRSCSKTLIGAPALDCLAVCQAQRAGQQRRLIVTVQAACRYGDLAEGAVIPPVNYHRCGATNLVSRVGVRLPRGNVTSVGTLAVAGAEAAPGDRSAWVASTELCGRRLICRTAGLLRRACSITVDAGETDFEYGWFYADSWVS